jgi:hypothetical protein
VAFVFSANFDCDTPKGALGAFHVRWHLFWTSLCFHCRRMCNTELISVFPDKASGFGGNELLSHRVHRVLIGR